MARGAFQTSAAAKTAKSDSAGNSNVTASAANSPAAAKSVQARRSSYQTRSVAASAMATHTAAGIWLLSVTLKVVKKVPNVAAAITKMRPQSVAPKRSASRPSTTK